MVIKCEECAREFHGNKFDEGKIFVCRFCMGEGLDPNKYHGKNGEALRILDEILNERWLLLKKDQDRLLEKVREVRRALK